MKSEKVKIVSDEEKKAVYEMYEANMESFAFNKEDRNSSSEIFLLLEETLKDVESVENLEKVEFPQEYLSKLELVESVLDEL